MLLKVKKIGKVHNRSKFSSILGGMPEIVYMIFLGLPVSLGSFEDTE